MTFAVLPVVSVDDAPHIHITQAPTDSLCMARIKSTVTGRIVRTGIARPRSFDNGDYLPAEGFPLGDIVAVDFKTVDEDAPAKWFGSDEEIGLDAWWVRGDSEPVTEADDSAEDIPSASDRDRRIIAILSERPKTVKDICIAMGRTDSASNLALVGGAVRRLQKEGLIEKGEMTTPKEGRPAQLWRVVA